MKIFISPFKGGTTSFATALQMVGYRRAEYDLEWNPITFISSPKTFNRRQRSLISDVGGFLNSMEFSEIDDTIKKSIKNVFADMLKSFAGDFEVFDDYPLGHDFVHIYIKKIVFPDAKFIFLERNEDEYENSYERHMLRPEYRHMLGHYPEIFKSGLGRLMAKKNYLEWRKRHLSLMKEFPEDVLITGVHDGWRGISEFFGFKEPSEPFPWENKGNQTEHDLVSICGHELLYCEEFDSDYCPVCVEWRQKKCEAQKCSFCSNRPEYPPTSKIVPIKIWAPENFVTNEFATLKKIKKGLDEGSEKST